MSAREAEARAPLIQPQIGMVLAGKYRVERVLGTGGMGFVMAARHVTLGKLVALKLMHANIAIDPTATQRFVREARAASRLTSEHIVRVIDLDMLEDGSPYIAMEYLEGEDLGALLARQGPRPVTEVAAYLVQVCEAIAEAHAAGIVHRDLKPANLFVTRSADGTPCVKVLDFGVSKIIAGGPFGDDLASTDTKALIGSPHYMAPEQLISAKSVDPRTDIWALGCILHELVVGAGPFNATSLAPLLASILRDEPPSLEHRGDLPPAFVAVIERCLAKDPAHRFQTAGELSAALAPFVATSPLASTAVPRSRRMVPIVSGIAIAVALAAIAVIGHVARTHRSPANIAAPSPDPNPNLHPTPIPTPTPPLPPSPNPLPATAAVLVPAPVPAPVRQPATSHPVSHASSHTRPVPRKPSPTIPAASAPHLEDDLLAPDLDAGH